MPNPTGFVTAVDFSASSSHRSSASGLGGGSGSGSGEQKSQVCNVNADNGRVSEKTCSSSERHGPFLLPSGCHFVLGADLVSFYHRIRGAWFIYYRCLLSSRITYALEYICGPNPASFQPKVMSSDGTLVSLTDRRLEQPSRTAVKNSRRGNPHP